VKRIAVGPEAKLTETLKFIGYAAVLTILVGVVGSWVAGPEASGAIWLGAGLAFLIQFVLFVVLFVIAFSSRPLLAHGLGMLGRFAAFGAVMLLWVPFAGVPAAPLLFSLVTVLFMTTLVEPLILIQRKAKS